MRVLVKSTPLVGPVARYLVGNLVQTGKKGSTVFAYGRHIKDRQEFSITKLDSSRSLHRNRLAELKSFYGLSSLQLAAHYLRNGTPNTTYYRNRMEHPFDMIDPTGDELKKTYATTSFMQAARYMLRYTRYDIGLKVLGIMRDTGLSPGDVTVLDYGCGVADPSLMLALHGVDATIVDLENPKFEFARSRFAARGLPVTAFGADQTEAPVDLGSSKFNFVIMSEFLEHVANPRRFLEYAIDRLDPGGVLFDSLGPIHHHGVGGSHLAEAKIAMETTGYERFHADRLEPLGRPYDPVEYRHFYFVRKGANGM